MIREKYLSAGLAATVALAPLAAKGCGSETVANGPPSCHKMSQSSWWPVAETSALDVGQAATVLRVTPDAMLNGAYTKATCNQKLTADQLVDYTKVKMTKVETGIGSLCVAWGEVLPHPNDTPIPETTHILVACPDTESSGTVALGNLANGFDN